VQVTGANRLSATASYLLHLVPSQPFRYKAPGVISIVTEGSIHAWETAISCLPTENLSTVEQALKEQFQVGLEEAKAAIGKAESVRPFIEIPKETVTIQGLPWLKAEAMCEELEQTKNFSSSVGQQLQFCQTC
jgi:hypothetical protein